MKISYSLIIVISCLQATLGMMMGKGKRTTKKQSSVSHENPNHDGFGIQQNGLGNNNQQNGLASQYDRVAYQHDGYFNNQYDHNPDNNFHSQGGRAYGQKSNSEICLERVADSERLLKYTSKAEWQSLKNLIEKAKNVCLAYDSNDWEKVKTLKIDLKVKIENFFEPRSQSSSNPLSEDQLLDQFYDQLKTKGFQVERKDSIDARVRSIIGEFGGNKGEAKMKHPNLVTFLELLDQI